MFKLNQIREITVVMVMCEKEKNNTGKTNFRKNERLTEYSIRINQTVTAIKSLLISWKYGDYVSKSGQQDILKVIIFSNNNSSFDRIKKELMLWSIGLNVPLSLEYRPASYPKRTIHYSITLPHTYILRYNTFLAMNTYPFLIHRFSRVQMAGKYFSSLQHTSSNSTSTTSRQRPSNFP